MPLTGSKEFGCHDFLLCPKCRQAKVKQSFEWFEHLFFFFCFFSLFSSFFFFSFLFLFFNFTAKFN